MTVRRLFLSPLWLFLSLPGYIGWRLLSVQSIGGAGVVAGTLLLVACCILIPLSVRTRTMRNQKLADYLSWAV